MNTGRYIAQDSKRLAFGRSCVAQLESGRTLRDIALGTGLSRQYVWRSVKAAELIDGPSRRRVHAVLDPLLR